MTLYPGKPVPEEIAAQGSKESKEWVQTDFLAYLQMKKDYSKLVKSIAELESKIAEYRSKENLPMTEQLQINLKELKSRKAAFSDFEQRNRNVTHESVLRSYEANQTLMLCLRGESSLLYR